MKIIALINAHALAHVSRALEISKVLERNGHEIVFAGHGNYLEVAAQAGFKTYELPYVPVEQLVKAIKSQTLSDIFKEKQLIQYIEAELDLYKQLNPDILLIDNRVTAHTSGELAKIPRVGILNVHMSVHKKIPFFSLRNSLNLKPNLFVELTDQIEKRFEHFFYDRLVMSDINKIRRQHGLPRKYSYELEEGDITLFCDVPEFNPVSKLRETFHFIGPLTWHNDLPEPECIKKLDQDKKCIYLTLGSDGLEELVDNLKIFAKEDIQVVMAAGHIPISTTVKLPDNVFIEKYINTDKLLPHCDLVVCHGGNGTLYQALNYGLPVVGFATHEEQYYGLKRINQLELGVGFSNKKFKKEGFKFLMDTVNLVLNESKYRENAIKFQGLIKQWNSSECAAELIEEFWQKITV